jgi:hypothetical protein
MTLLEDFGEELLQSVLIQSWLRNDGYKDIFSSGITYDCAISYQTKNIIKSDGTESVTNALIYLNALAPVVSDDTMTDDLVTWEGAPVTSDVDVSVKDKVTFNGASPKILKVTPDYDLENGEVYSLVIYT